MLCPAVHNGFSSMSRLYNFPEFHLCCLPFSFAFQQSISPTPTLSSIPEGKQTLHYCLQPLLDLCSTHLAEYSKCLHLPHCRPRVLDLRGVTTQKPGVSHFVQYLLFYALFRSSVVTYSSATKGKVNPSCLPHPPL